MSRGYRRPCESELGWQPRLGRLHHSQRGAPRAPLSSPPCGGLQEVEVYSEEEKQWTVGLGKMGSNCSHLCLQDSSDRLRCKIHSGVTGTRAHLCELAICQSSTQRPGESQQTGESASLAASGPHKRRGLNQPWQARGGCWPDVSRALDLASGHRRNAGPQDFNTNS